MLKSIIQKILFILLLVIAETAFFAVLGFSFDKFNFVLVCLLFLGFIHNFHQSIIYGLIIGFILDHYSALFFGAFFLALPISILISQKIFSSFLTNRSFYSLLILVLISTIAYQLILFIYYNIQVFLATKEIAFVFASKNFLINLFEAEIMNLCFASLLYWTVALMTKHFSAALSTDFEPRKQYNL